MTTKKKVLCGCLGCGGLAALGIGVGLGLLLHWIKEVTVPVPGEAIVTPDTVEVLVIDADPGRAGVAEFVRALGEQIDRDRPGAIDQKMRDFMRKLDHKDGAAILSSFLPLSFARASTKGPLKEGHASLSFGSLSHWANVLRRVETKRLEEAGWSRLDHGDAAIYARGEGDSADAECCQGNSVFRAADARAIGEAVDAVAAWKGSMNGSPLLNELRARLSAKPAIWGLLANKDDAAGREFGFLEGLSVSSREVEGIAWEIDIQSADKASGHFHVKAKDPLIAISLQKQLTDRSEAVRQALKDQQDLDATFTSRADGVWVSVDFELKDLTRRVIKAMAEGK